MGWFFQTRLQSWASSSTGRSSGETVTLSKAARSSRSSDIAELTEAAASVEGTVLEDVYEHLIAGSTRHLDAFDNFIA